MIIVTSEYIFTNPELNEINGFVDDTIREHNKKDGDNYCRKIEFNYIIQVFEKIKNKIKKN